MTTANLTQNSFNPIIGNSSIPKLFRTEEKQHPLKNYPLVTLGTSGSGKTHTMFSIFNQLIKNGEGVFYLSNYGDYSSGDPSTFRTLFSYMSENNRLEDLYCLNFCEPNKSQSIKNFQRTNSIDPINPMVGSKEYFEFLFGRLGIILNDVLIELHQNKEFIDIQFLDKFFTIDNLLELNQTPKFKTTEIEKYLIEIGFSLNEDIKHQSASLLKHAEISRKALESIEMLKKHNDVFKLNASVKIENIIKHNKVLLILLPSIERSSEYFKDIANIITYQINYINQKIKHYKSMNVILTNPDDWLNLKLFNENSFDIGNYMFTCDARFSKNEIFDFLINISKTQFVMKAHLNELPEKIKSNLIHNVNTIDLIYSNKNLSLVHNFRIKLAELYPGEGYIFSETSRSLQNDFSVPYDHTLSLAKIKSLYLPPKQFLNDLFVPQRELEESENS